MQSTQSRFPQRQGRGWKLEILRRDQVYIERLYSFAEAGKIQLIRTQGQLLSEEYVPDGIEVKAYVPKEIWGKV